jgi:hypothetical protein
MFSFPEACWGGGEQMLGWRSLGIFCFSFLMSELIFLMGSLFGSRGGRGVEGVALFSYAVIVVEAG